MNEILLYFLIGLFILALLGLIFSKWIHLFFERHFFVRRNGQILYKIAKNKDYFLLHNIAIQIDDNVVHLSHLLAGDKYLYCFVDRYFKGALEGLYSDDKWLMYADLIHKIPIDNPLVTHDLRINNLNSMLGSVGDKLLVGIVVVNNSVLIDPKLIESHDGSFLCYQKDLKKMIIKYEANNDVAKLDPTALSETIQFFVEHNKKDA